MTKVRTDESSQSITTSGLQPLARTRENLEKIGTRNDPSGTYLRNSVVIQSRSIGQSALSDDDVHPDVNAGEPDTGSPDHKPQDVVKPPKIFARRPIADTRFISLQSWEGVVEEVFSTYFTALVVEPTSTVEEFAEIAMEEISPADRELLEPGARFYWSIGYQQNRFGQRTRSSVVRFRRVAPYQRDEQWAKTVGETWLSL